MWRVELWHCGKSVEEYGILSGREKEADRNMALSGQLMSLVSTRWKKFQNHFVILRVYELYMYAPQWNRIECVSRLNATPLAWLAIWVFLRHLGLTCPKGCDVN